MDQPTGTPPNAHPPSPRQQRAAIGAPSVSRARTTPSGTERTGYLRRHWRGELPLAAAVIISGALIWAAVQLIMWLERRVFPITEQPHVASALWMIQMVVLLAGAVWWGRGVQRAAIRHVDVGGSVLVALAAGLAGLAAFFWAAAFWWFSARHIAPEIWATLAGTTQPATVSVDATSADLLVRGDLEFGSARALRMALDASPGTRVVRIESRGGRVKEGVAMGLLLRDRGVDTLVSTECSSACVTAFAGGARRLITADAKLGLHSAGGAGATAQSVAEANRESDAFIASRGVDLRVLEKGSAVANSAIWFPPPWVLLASGLATHYAHELLPR